MAERDSCRHFLVDGDPGPEVLLTITCPDCLDTSPLAGLPARLKGGDPDNNKNYDLHCNIRWSSINWDPPVFHFQKSGLCPTSFNVAVETLGFWSIRIDPQKKLDVIDRLNCGLQYYIEQMLRNSKDNKDFKFEVGVTDRDRPRRLLSDEDKPRREHPGLQDQDKGKLPEATYQEKLTEDMSTEEWESDHLKRDIEHYKEKIQTYKQDNTVASSK